MAGAAPHFLKLHNEAALLMQQTDWSTSPLGNPGTWPQSLRNYVELMLESKFPMFLAWGPELGFVYNDPYIPILGAKHPAAMGRPFKEIWSEIWDDVGPVVDTALSGTASFFENLPLLMQRKGYEEPTWFTFSYSPIRSEDGNIAGLFCACTETTANVLAEQQRVRENERLKTLFTQAPGYIAILNGATHVFEFVNDAYYKVVGVRELVGKPVREALPELEGQSYFELLDEVFRTGKPFVGRGLSAQLRRSGSEELEQRYLDFVQQPIVDNAGNITGIFVEGTDVTETVIAAAAIRESEARLRQLANTIPHLAWMANPDGHLHWYNDRWYDYTGTTLESMQGWGWQDVHDPAYLPSVVAHWKQSLETGEPWEITFPIRSASGEFRMFASRAAPLRDAAGNIVQWFGTNTDVTEALVAQDGLREANQRKDEFLAMLAHELRNPLAPISTAAELLSVTQADNLQVRNTAKIISRQVAHMTKLVDDLLDVSRVTRGLVTLRTDVFDVGTVIAEAVEQVHSLADAKRQRLRIEQDGSPVFVLGDRTRLTQVFSNLLNNAIRYTPASGSIDVRMALRQTAVVITVRDNGIGVAPSLAPHIFDLFTQGERSSDRSQGGLGLGLALVKSLVELHHGKVSLHSEGTGMGSEFTVELPLAPDTGSISNEPDASDSPMPAPRERAMMVVDDNEDAAQMLSMLLETIGHRVWVAHTAQDALRVAQDAAPAILFLDIGLPDMDGYALAGHLRASPSTASSVLVAVTGYGQPENRDKALQAGFDHHLVKPVKFSSVLELIDKLHG